MQLLNETKTLENHVSVCICTYKRPGLLAHLLEELQVLRTNDFFTYSIVVVDNDVNGSAKLVVEGCRQRSSVNIYYFIEPEQNIALARNKAVENAKGNLVAFIDDDEYPESNWLTNLHKTLVDLNADGVLGPVLPYYPHGTPKWIIKSGLCELPSYKTGAVLHWIETKTGNVLLKRSIFDGNKMPFDPQFGRTGGEDQDFFRRMMREGRRFIWSNDAIVYETVYSERWKRMFYLKKYSQMGGGTGQQMRKRPLSFKCKWFAKAMLSICFYSLVLPFSALIGQHLFMKCLIKNAYYLSWFIGFLWRPVIKFRY